MTVSISCKAAAALLCALALPACMPTIASPHEQRADYTQRIEAPDQSHLAASVSPADFTPARLYDVKLLPGPGIVCKGPGCAKRYEINRWERSYKACQSMRFDANCRQVIELYPQAIAYIGGLKSDRELTGMRSGKKK